MSETELDFGHKQLNVQTCLLFSWLEKELGFSDSSC